MEKALILITSTATLLVFVKFSFLGILFVYSAMELEFISMLLLQLFSENDSITICTFVIPFQHGKEKRLSEILNVESCSFSQYGNILAKT